MAEFRRNAVWALLFLAVIGVLLAVILIPKNSPAAGKTAKIVQNGAVINTVNLENITAPYDFTITNDNGGENTIRVENGRIAVIHANCPDKICVNRGFIENDTLPIVCLPNRLSVYIENDGGDIDAVSGGDGQ